MNNKEKNNMKRSRTSNPSFSIGIFLSDFFEDIK